MDIGEHLNAIQSRLHKNEAKAKELYFSMLPLKPIVMRGELKIKKSAPAKLIASEPG